MSLPAFMRIKGARQGLITSKSGTMNSIGGKARHDHEDEIIVQGYDDEVINPIDMSSGGATGKRAHKPIKILKQFDGSTPLLLQALCTNETLSITIKWYRISSSGNEEQFFTMEIEGAICSGIERHMANCLDPANHFHEPMEWVSFSYKRISVTHEGMHTTYVDEWGSRT